MLGSSECSSGCESGWTLYLDHSASSPSPSSFGERRSSKYSWDQQHYVHQEEEEYEDLSMVSDASSGPRNILEEEDSMKEMNFADLKKQNKREKKRRDEKMKYILDDTASSPIINTLHKSVGGSIKKEQSTLDYSQGFSAIQFQDKSAFHEQYGYLHMETRL